MKKFDGTRRRVLSLFGLGAAGTLLAVSGSKSLFAKQFVGEAARVKMPDMVYDPELQQMVNPLTRKPIYDDVKDVKVASGYPTVTAGCPDCPNKDDDGQ